MGSFRFYGLGLALSTASVNAATLTLPANDTYLDSSNQTGSYDFSRANYGHFGSIKAVYNNYNPNSDFGLSAVHSVFTLPAQLFSDAPTGVGSAVVEFLVRTNTLTSKTTNNIINSVTAELHPLTHAFVAGDGGTPSQTRETGAPTAPNSPTPHGADWHTFDGTTAWTDGGSFDSASSPIGIFKTVGSSNYVDFDISSLLNNSTTYSEIKNNGLLLKITQEGRTDISVDNATLSLFSADTGSPGSLSYTVPEPTSLSFIGVGMLMRRRATGGN